MKLELLVSQIATLGLIATAVGLAADTLSVPLFAVSAGLLVLLVLVRDYSRRGAYHLAPHLVRPRELRPLAA